MGALYAVSVANAEVSENAETTDSDVAAPIPVYSAAAVTQRLASRQLMHGLFEQTRELRGVSGGLTSTGEFYFWRGHGIYLATLEPVLQATTYRSDVTLRWLPGQTQPKKLNGRQDRHFRELLIAIFDFDEEKLARDFKQAWTFGDSGWQLALEPRNFASKRFLESITLWGSQNIDRLSIVSQSGETLHIAFTATNALLQPPVQVCRERFLYSAQTCDMSVEHGPK